MQTEKKINILKLTKYGFDQEILDALIKYELLPPIEKYEGKKGPDYFVKEEHVLLLINRMLKNELKMYEMYENGEKNSKTLIETIKNEAVKL